MFCDSCGEDLLDVGISYTAEAVVRRNITFVGGDVDTQLIEDEEVDITIIAAVYCGNCDTEADVYDFEDILCI